MPEPARSGGSAPKTAWFRGNRPYDSFDGALDRPGKLVGELVHPVFERPNHVGDAILRRAGRPPLLEDEQHEQDHDAHREGRRYGDEQGRHRFDVPRRPGPSHCNAVRSL